MAEATSSAVPMTAPGPPYHALAVGLHEAALDSPTFRATSAHFADQIDAVERWLNGYVSSTSRMVHEILGLEETINGYLTKTIPSAADGVIDNDYTFLALKRVGDGTRECLMQLISSTKRMESTVVEPVRSFLVGDMRNFKEIRKVLEQAQRTYDSTLARYLSQSKTKEPSHLREDAFSVYETRKAYLQASMDYCQLAPQVRFTMDKLLVKVAGEIWKEMKRGRDATANATRWEQEMERVRGWSREMEASESVFRRELQTARRDLGENALTGCKPSRELDDYSTSTVAFLGSRGPMNLGPRDGGAVISEKQGWLYLRTVSGKPARHNWVRRWYYCRDSVFGWLIPAPQGVLQGDEIGVLLCNARPAPGEDRRFCLEVKTKSQTMLLQAETQGELTEWLEVFEVTKKKAFEVSMGRDANPNGSADPAFSINPPTIPEFSARVLDAQLGLTADEAAGGLDRASTLAVPPAEGPLANRASFDVNNSVARRSITALGRDLAREEGESGREHAARIIQKLDLHRKATFGAGAEAALASSAGAAGGVASLIAASHNLIPAGASPVGGSTRQGSSMLPSVDNHPGTLAPLTLAKPPAVTSLSRTAVFTAGQRDDRPPTSVVANYWGSNLWGTINAPDPDPVLPRHDDDDPVGVVVSPDGGADPTPLQKRHDHDVLPPNYPPELRVQYGQFRLLFPNAPPEEKLVLVFRAAWSTTSSESESESGEQALSGDGRVYVTPVHMYFYGEQMGLITSYSLSLDAISAVTAMPGAECDYIFLHLGQNITDTGHSTITLKVFLDDLNLLHARLNMLVDDLQAEVPMETEDIVTALINVEQEVVDRANPELDNWAEAPGPEESTPRGEDGSPARRPTRGLLHDQPSRLQMPPAGLRLAVPPKVNLPSRPVEFTPDDMGYLATERHFEISAKSCFHVIFGDRSFVFPKLYFERRAQQIAQGPWVPVDQGGRMRREFQFKVDHRDIFGRAKTVDVIDHQTVDVHKEHITYVVTYAKTAWHLPHSQNLKVVFKIVITFVAKSKCRLAIYVRVDWNKAPALSKNLVERQAYRDGTSDAEELAELATEQVRKLGARSRTHKAVQMYGSVGQQKKVVLFSPAATEASRKQAVKPRTLTALIWETVRSFGESAVTSLIMWAFAGVRKLFEVVKTQRLLLALLGLSVLANLLVTSGEAGAWLRERHAAHMLRHLGIGPNTVMSKAIYMADLPEASGSGRELSFPRDSDCFASFEEVLNTTDMDAPWEDAGHSLPSPSSRATARRLRHARQRLGTYRHDLVVAMRVVNSVEREMLQSEWENWLLNEVSLCDDLAALLQDGGSAKGADDDESSGTGAARTMLDSLPPGRREALEEWRGRHCGSCKKDYADAVAGRKMASAFEY